MAALWRRSAYFSFIRSSVRFLFRKPSVRSSHRWSRLYSGVASLAVSGGLCAVPFKQVDDLSHESLVRRAASLVTNSSNTFLSQTTLALIDALTEYSKAVHTLISLHEQYLASLGKLTPAQEDSVWQVIISQRGEVNDRHDALRRFESTWVTAVKLCEMAAEAAYVSGAEQASVMVRTNIQVAQSQVEAAQKLSLDADKKLAATKVMEVERMTQHAASLQSSDDGEETPEAYLRED
ncbi:diablo IAP-binding mitochondrial protein [Nothobranchius furzeri]|uniref:Direct IAP-binding protein with low pI n=1 Tax=Nothobranchius furzeri TaxID=105023 RepID=A0A1A8UYA9_NOTFU|nr:diablo, IAP-binding mitochondrial protein a [Nothobranchius furzeri]KAF7218435.1 diablo IAP-binding mitochondrial protein [Nothobranchius furzeri]